MNVTKYMLIFLFLLFHSPAFGEEMASPWVENEYVRTRIISAQNVVSETSDLPLYIAWEIEMKKEGWKTYWRSPGDAGKPTVFDWEGSANIAEVDVLFPIPERFEIFDIQSFGYEEKLILPIAIKPFISGAPVSVKVKADFMSCNEICVPFIAEYELDIPSDTFSLDKPPTTFAAIIFDQLDKIPGKPGNLLASDIKLKDYSLKGQAGRQRLYLSIVSQKLLTGADVIVESENHFRFDVPQKKLLGRGNEVTFVIPIGSTIRDADLRGKEVTLTLIDGWGGAIETKITLD